MTKRSCRNCQFWGGQGAIPYGGPEADLDETFDRKTATEGFCWFNPPVDRVRPKTYRNEMCGHFQEAT